LNIFYIYIFTILYFYVIYHSLVFFNRFDNYLMVKKIIIYIYNLFIIINNLITNLIINIFEKFNENEINQVNDLFLIKKNPAYKNINSSSLQIYKY
jgi:hypothetical protein